MVCAELKDVILPGQQPLPLLGVQRDGPLAHAVDADCSLGRDLEGDGLPGHSLSLQGLILGLKLGNLCGKDCGLVLEDSHGVCPVCGPVGLIAAGMATRRPNCGDNMAQIRSFQGHFVAFPETRTKPRE